MKSILIVADMEGTIGRYAPQDYLLSKKQMFADVEFVIRHLKRRGYGKIGVLDCHNNGHNIDEIGEIFPDVVHFAQIWNVDSWHQYEEAILVGFHAKKGVDDLYAHTLRPEIEAIMLGDESIGEVTWIVNTLAAYGISTKGIAGTEGLRSEAKSLGIPFFSSISKQTLNIDWNDTAEKLGEFIDERFGENTQNNYVSSQLNIVFTSPSILECFPQRLFTVSQDKLTFANTLDFNSRAYGMCKFINAWNAYRMELAQEIRGICHKYLTRDELNKIKDNKFQKILNRKEVDNLSISDLNYILSVVQKELK